MYENVFFFKFGWSFLILLPVIFICMQSKFDNIKVFIILINYGCASKYTHTTDLALLFDTIAYFSYV